MAVALANRFWRLGSPKINHEVATRLIDVINELKSYGVYVFVHAPVVTADEARHEYAIDLVAWDELPVADALVVAVPTAR